MDIGSLMAQYPIISSLFVLAASLAILIKSADLAVVGISKYAHKFGISDFVIGFIVLAIGTSLPEFVSSVMGGLAQQGGIVFGTMLGSGVLSITAVLGILAIYSGRMTVEDKMLGKSKNYLMLLPILPLILVIDGTLSRIDGFILIAVYLAYLAWLWYTQGTLGQLKKDVKFEKFWEDAVIFVGALAALLLSARWLVFSSINLAQSMHVSPFFIAMTVIAIGASLPDLTVELKSIRSGHARIGFGNLLGGIITTMLLMLGMVAVLMPIQIAVSTIYVTGIFFVVSYVFVLWFTRDGTITRKEGFVLLGLYLLLIALQLLKEFGLI